MNVLASEGSHIDRNVAADPMGQGLRVTIERDDSRCVAFGKLDKEPTTEVIGFLKKPKGGSRPGNGRALLKHLFCQVRGIV
jgi:hypothetical protein